MKEMKITTQSMDKTAEELHQEIQDDFIRVIDLNETIAEILVMADHLSDLAYFGFQVANLLKEKGILNPVVYEALVGEI